MTGVTTTKPITEEAKTPSVKHAPETEVPKKQPEPKTEEIQKHEPYWFVSDLSFEKKKNRTNRLIVTLKHRNGNKTKDATVYVWHNVTIPTGLIYSLEEVEKILKRHLSDSSLSLQKHTVYLSKRAYEVVNRLIKDYPTVEFIESYRKMSVIHVTLPLNKELTDKLGSEFQAGGHDAQAARILKLRNKKIIVDKRLEEAMLVRNEVRALQKQVKECAYRTIPENGSASQAKRTRLLNEILKFFDSHEAMIELSVEDIRKKHPQFSKFVLLDNPEVQTIIGLER
ncbi:MAG: hypothetical protein IH948_07590, partial [Bacteroidetes bacterium]|nr:hypothetical protein [Bacteroidota bacterium]